MSKYKNYDWDNSKRKLKKADREKNNDNIHLGADLLFGKNDALAYKKNKARRRLPLAVDIIIAILLLAIAIGIVVGAYFGFRYFTVDYESVTIEYTILAKTDNAKAYSDIVGKHIYKDEDKNTLYMGKITSADVYSADGEVVIKVQLDANYKSEEGYFAENFKISVGKSIKVRTESFNINGEIVELKKITKPKKTYSGALISYVDVDLAMIGGGN